VYITVKFKGTYCELVINEQGLWGKNHNYVEIVIDDKPIRIQTTEKNNHIIIAQGLTNTVTYLINLKIYGVKYWVPGIYRFKMRSTFTIVGKIWAKNGIHWQFHYLRHMQRSIYCSLW